jgi:CheY-like chemotaxis protein
MAGRAAPDPASTQAEPRRLPGAGRVLVIEDEVVIRDTLEVLVSIEGCEVRTAGDGTRALALMQDWTPDLILLDLTLPGMSGAEFIAAYHRTPEPHAPIILLTARSISRAEATALGAAGVLPKPFDVTDLLDVVAAFADCDDGA